MTATDTTGRRLLIVECKLRIRNPFISFSILGRSLQLYGKLITVDKDAWFGLEEPVNILQRPALLLAQYVQRDIQYVPVSGFGVEEVGDRNEGKAYDGPNDPEFIA